MSDLLPSDTEAPQIGLVSEAEFYSWTTSPPRDTISIHGDEAPQIGVVSEAEFYSWIE